MGGGKSTDNHNVIVLVSLMWLYTTPQSYDFFLKLARISGVFFEKIIFGRGIMDLVIAMIPWAYGTQKRTQYSVLSTFPVIVFYFVIC